MKKLLAMLLAISCLLAFSSFAMADEAPVVTALIGTSQLPAEENSILDEIRARTGINFQPTMVEGSAYTEKFNTLAAAGMLPDIINISGYDQLMEMIEFGAILPLNDLLDAHGQEIVANQGDALYNTIAVVDDVVYGIPLSQVRLSAMMVRQDWLDALGLEVPTTLDEFYEVAVAFTKNDPDGDGQDDTVALAATMAFPATVQFLFAANGVPYSAGGFDYNILVDGEVKPYFMHEDYLTSIEFIRKLLSEGLMEPDFVTIANMSSLEKLWNGTHGFYFGDPIGTTNNWLVGGRYTEDPLPVMTYSVLTDAEGEGGTILPQYTSFLAISSTCENPEAAMQLLNYICSEEGNQLAYAGIQGKHWDWNEDGTISYLNEYADSAAHRDDGGYMYFPCLRFDGLERQILNDTTRYGYEVAEANLLPYIYLVQTPAAQADITFDANEMMASLVTTTGDLQAEYDAYIAEFLNNGGTEWIQQATEIYNASIS